MKNRNRRFVAKVESMEGRYLLSTVPHYTVQDLGVSNIGILPNGFPMSISLSPTGSAIGIAVNNSGQITGTSTPPPGVYAQNHAFFYSGGVMTDITPGAWTGEGIAINNSGQVAGVESPLNGYEQAFVTGPNGTGMTVINGNGSGTGFAFGINSSGDVVGRAGTAGTINGWSHGFLYKNGTFYDLNDLLVGSIPGPISGDYIANAFSIDDNGQIHALGYGTERYLLTPVPQPVAPTITWSNPADIVYGTPLSATQLDATASVPGTFTYNVATGTVLHAGAAQTLTATFTPDDLTHYTTATAEVFLNVKKHGVVAYTSDYVLLSPNGVDTTNLWNGYVGSVTYGNPVSILVHPHPSPNNIALDPTTSMAITLTRYVGSSNGIDITEPFGNYTIPIDQNGNVSTPPITLPAGTYDYTVSFPDNSDFYMQDSPGSIATVRFRVNQAPLTVTMNNATKIYGQSNPVFTGTVTGLVNGDSAANAVYYITDAPANSPVGTYQIVPELIGRNYTIPTYTPGILTVTPAPLTVTANNAQVRYGFQIPPLTGTITGLVNGDTDVATYTTTAVRGSWAGYYPIVPHLTDPNYNITFVNGTLIIYWSVPPGGC